MNKNELEVLTRDYRIRERSNYQLKHFVIGQHDTPEMRYRQIIIEAKDLLQKIKHAEIRLKMMQIKMSKLEASDSEIKKLRAEAYRLDIVSLEDMVNATKEELAFLVELSKDYRYYSPSDIEDNQAAYWELRLTRQATTDRMALEQGVTAGNLASMISAGLVSKELSQ